MCESFFNRGRVVLTSKDVVLFNRKSERIRYGAGDRTGGANECEKKANKNMLIERRREREKANRKKYYEISTSPGCFSFSSVRRDVLLGMTKRYFTISMTPVCFGFYILGFDDKGVQKNRDGGPGRNQDWELPLDNDKPSAPPRIMMRRYTERFGGEGS